MCFSATASFTTGAILLSTWVITLYQVKDKSSIPFASIPLIFGIQQIIEGLVWISFNSSFFHSIVVYIFVLIAYVFWPIYTPIAIFFIEKERIRRKILLFISALWTIVWIYIFINILNTWVNSSIVSNSICYNVPIPYAFITFSLYFLSVCLWIIVSSSKKIRFFGISVLLSFFIAHFFYPETSFSVWCFFSAALSIIIYIHMKDLKKLLLT